MGKLTEKAKNIKKIASILKTLSAKYVKEELVETLTDKTDDKYSLEGLVTGERFADGSHIVRNGYRKTSRGTFVVTVESPLWPQVIP